MKITGVSTTALSLPRPARYSSEGAGSKREWGRLGRMTSRRPKRVLEYVIVRVETDEGITGVGEAATDIGFFGEPLEEVRSAIDIHMGPRIIGRDPFDREGILDQIDFRGNSCARSGIDLAIHDLLGRALGIPVSALIGGRAKDRVPVSVEIAGGSPEDMAALCVECIGKGDPRSPGVAAAGRLATQRMAGDGRKPLGLGQPDCSSCAQSRPHMAIAIRRISCEYSLSAGPEPSARE